MMNKYYTLLPSLTLLVLISFSGFSQNVKWGSVMNTTYDDYIQDLRVDKDKNLIICGAFSGTVDFDPGPGSAVLSTGSGSNGNIFLAKYDSLGNYLWAFQIGGGSFYDSGDRVAVDTSGNIFLTGMFASTADFNPSPSATFSLSSWSSGRSRFLAKYDPAGNFIAAKNVGNAVGNLPSSQDAQTGLGCDADGNVYMSGFYGTSLTLGPGVTLPAFGLSDNYFSKYDPQLNLIWGHRIGSTETEYSQGMFVHPSGKILVLGSFRDIVDFNPGPGVDTLSQTSSTQDGYFACYDSSGQFLFVRQLEAGTSATPIATFFDASGNIVLAGSCAGTMDADPGPQVATVGAGFNDQAFIAMYDSLGNYKWAHAYGDIGSYNAIRYTGTDSAGSIFVAGNYNPMTDINPGGDTAVFGNKYGAYVASYDTLGNFLTAFYLQEAKMRVDGSDLFLCGGFYGLVDFDPGPSVFQLQSDTANASWYLLRLGVCENYAQIPDLITASQACAGDTIILNVTGGGPQYGWEFSTGLTAVSPSDSSQILVLADSLAVSETIFVSSSGGCQNSPMIYTTISINQPLVSTITQLNDTLYATPGAVSWQWYLAGVEIPGATDSIYAPTVSGLYTVLITDTNGCQSLSEPFNYVVSSVTSVEVPGMIIAPSPFSETLTITLPGGAGLVEVFDVTGRMVYSGELSAESVVLNTSGWNRGVYLVKLKHETGQQVIRVIRQ